MKLAPPASAAFAFCLPLLGSILPAAEPPPWIDPLSPEQSRLRIHLPPGYRAELVASEPMIEEPVMCAWDANGRMYVAEMRSYMQDTDGTGRNDPIGRIKRLEDTDGDGRMDRVTVFADNLLLPRIIAPLDDRIIVRETHDPNFFIFRDTDGDGQADERSLLGKGLHASPNESVEHEDSGLLWNIDNWLYTAKGGSRYRYTRGTWEVEKCETQGDNQWGLGMDDVGNLFFSHNSFPGRGFQQPWYAWSLLALRKEGKYLRPKLGPTDTDAEFQRIFPAPHVGDRNNDPNKSFTSACGISIYRGDAMPGMRGDMFLCEPCSHVVRRAKVLVKDGKRTLKNAYEGGEFFASGDFYTRPVWTATGPDGCLYIVDMYRGIIQDKPWVDASFAKRIQAMGADRVKRQGRIWRIVPEKFNRPQPKQLISAPAAELVGHLADANGFTRDAAQRLLVLRHEKTVVPVLQTMGREHSDPVARLHALWTLEGLDALDPGIVFAALGDRDPRVRAAALRLCEPWIKQGDKTVHERVAPLAVDADYEVLRQVILSLGWSPLPEAVQTIEKVVESHIENEVVYLAAMTALWGKRIPLVERLLTPSAFQRITDPVLRDNVRQRWKAGILSWSGAKSSPRVLDAESIDLVHRGATVYSEVCATCHGPDGKGQQPPGSLPLAPALDGSQRLLGQKERLVRIVLHGLKGELDGKHYAGDAMPALSALSDFAIAAALSYARQSWSNNEEAIREEEVAAVRKASSKRTEPWAPEEVDAFSAPVLIDGHPPVPGARAAQSKPGPLFLGYRGYASNKTLGKPMESDGTKRGPWVHGQMSPGHWFAVDLVQPAEITAVVLDSRETNWFPRGWELRVSEDGIQWGEPIATGRGTHSVTSITFEPVRARFFKITQTAQGAALDSDGRRADLWQVFGFRVHGRKVAGSNEPVSTAAEVSSAVLKVDQNGGQALKETPLQTRGTPAAPIEKKAEAKPSPSPAPSSSPRQHPGGTPQHREKKAPLRALIIDGQSNHDFRGTSEGVRGILASTGRFGDWSHVTVSRSPIWWEQREPLKPKAQDPAAQEQFAQDVKFFSEARQAYYKQSGLMNSIWRPPFDETDVVILNYNGSSWPDHVQQAFTRFVENGGGVVVVHAANNAFENWPAYNQMLGIGWRSPKFGRWIAVDDTNGQLIEVPEEKPAASTHGDFIPFVVKTRAPQHPIMAGFPDEWMHAADELYARMRGSPEGLEVLATAFSPGAKQHEPVVWCKNYGKGRVVTTSMGHYQRPAHYSSLNCVGFQAVLARSCEWAATGTVTIPVPADFPTKDGSSVSPPKQVRWKGQ